MPESLFAVGSASSGAPPLIPNFWLKRMGIQTTNHAHRLQYATGDSCLNKLTSTSSRRSYSFAESLPVYPVSLFITFIKVFPVPWLGANHLNANEQYIRTIYILYLAQKLNRSVQLRKCQNDRSAATLHESQCSGTCGTRAALHIHYVSPLSDIVQKT